MLGSKRDFLTLTLFFLLFQRTVNSLQIKVELSCVGFSCLTHFRHNRVLPHNLIFAQCQQGNVCNYLLTFQDRLSASYLNFTLDGQRCQVKSYHILATIAIAGSAYVDASLPPKSFELTEMTIARHVYYLLSPLAVET